MANLEYTIMLHAVQTGEFTQLRTELENLKKFVNEGADFPIRIGDVQQFRKQIQDTIRESLKQVPGGGGSRPGSAGGGDVGLSAALDTKLGGMLEKLDTLITLLQREGVEPPGVQGTDNATKAAASMAGAVSTLSDLVRRLNATIAVGKPSVLSMQAPAYEKMEDVEQIKARMSSPQEQARLQGQRDFTRKAAIAEYNELVTMVQKLVTDGQFAMTDEIRKRVASLRTAMDSIPREADTEEAKVAVRTTVKGIYETMRSIAIDVMNDVQAEVRESTSRGSIPRPYFKSQENSSRLEGDPAIQQMARQFAQALGSALQDLLPELARGPNAQEGQDLAGRRTTKVPAWELEQAMSLAGGDEQAKVQEKLKQFRDRLYRALATNNTLVVNTLQDTIKELEDEAAKLDAAWGGQAPQRPPLGAEAVRRVIEASKNPGSQAAASLASGYRWYAGLDVPQQERAAALAQQKFVPIVMQGTPKEREQAVRRSMDILGMNTPNAVFSPTGSSEATPEVMQARGRWSSRMQEGRRKFDTLMSEQGLPAQMAALPEAAADALADILRRQRTLEIWRERASRNKGLFTPENATELDELQKMTTTLPIVQGMDVKIRDPQMPARDIYKALYGPRNFMHASSLRMRDQARQFALDNNVATQFQIPASSLSIQELVDQGVMPSKEGRDLQEHLAQWQTDNGLQFARSTANREKALVAYMRRIQSVRSALESGQLPEESALALRDMPNILDEDASAIREQWEAQRTTLSNLGGRRANKEAYADVLKALETRWNFAERELQIGGIYGRPEDRIMRERAAMHPDLGLVIGTRYETRDGELLVDPGAVQYGGRHMSAYWSNEFNTPKVAGPAPATSAPVARTYTPADQDAAMAALRAVSSRLSLDPDKNKYIDSVTGQEIDRVTSVLEQKYPYRGKKSSTDTALQVGNITDEVLRDRFENVLKSRDAYKNAAGEVGTATEEAFQSLTKIAENFRAQLDRLGFDIVDAKGLQLMDPQGRFAGTQDVLLRHRATGAFGVADIKTTSSKENLEKNLPKYDEQTSMYGQAVTGTTGIETVFRAVLPVLTQYDRNDPRVQKAEALPLTVFENRTGTGQSPIGQPPIPPASGLPSLPGDGVRVFVTNFSELDSMSNVDTGRIDSALAKMQRAIDLVMGVRPKGAAGEKDVLREREQLGRIQVLEAEGRIKVETTRKILEMRAAQAANRTNASRVGRILGGTGEDVASPTLGLASLGGTLDYGDNADTWQRDVLSLFSRYRRATSAMELVRLTMQTEMDKGQLDKLQKRLNARVDDRTLAQIQMAQMMQEGLEAGVAPTWLSSVPLQPYMQVAQTYALGRAGIQDLATYRTAQNELETQNMPVQTQLKQGAVALSRLERIKAQLEGATLAEDKASDLETLKEERDRLQTVMQSMKTEDEIAAALDGVVSRQAAANTLRRGLGLTEKQLEGLGPEIMKPIAEPWGKMKQLGIKPVPETDPAMLADLDTRWAKRFAELPESYRATFARQSGDNQERFVETWKKADDASWQKYLAATQKHAESAAQYDVGKVREVVQRILGERQSALDEVLARIAQKEAELEPLRKEAPRSPTEYAVEKMAAEKEVATVLGTTDVEKAQAAMAKLNGESQATEATIAQLKNLSTQTFANLQMYFGQLADELQKTNPKLSEALRQPIRDVASLEKALNALGLEFNDLGKQVDAAALRMGDGGFFGGLTRKFRSLSQYLMAGGVLYAISDNLRNNMLQLRQLDGELASVQGILDGRSPVDRAFVEAGALQTAREYGVTPLDAVRSIRLFAQTGAPAPEAVELGRAAQAAQIGLGIDQNTATEMLVATRNVFDNAVKPFEVLDRIARLEARYAVSTNDLSQAIQRAGPLFEQFQPQAQGSMTSLDLLLGSTTSIVEQTRVSGNQAATALRFMLSRLAQPDVARKLQNQYGINLAGESPNEMRPVSDILRDISKKYQELSKPDAEGNVRSLDAANLLVTFAGARQANAAAALLEDFNKVLEQSVESSLAYGDVQERLRIQLDTVPGQLGRFQAALTSAYQAIYTNSGIQAITKGSLSAASGVLNWAGEQESPGAALAVIGGAGALAATALKKGTARLATTGGTVAQASSGMMAGPLGKALKFFDVASDGPLVSGLGVFGKVVAKLGTVFGSLTMVGGVLTALEVFGFVYRNLIQVGEKFDLKAFDRAQLNQSDTGKALTETAQRFNMSEDAVITAYATAAQKVFAPENLAALGLTQDDVNNRRFDRANAAAVERAFVQALRNENVDLSEYFKEGAEQINEALRNAANMIRYENAPNQDRVAQLRTRFRAFQDEITSEDNRNEVSRRNTNDVPGVQAENARKSLADVFALADTLGRSRDLLPGLRNGQMMLSGSGITMDQAFRHAAASLGQADASELAVVSQTYAQQLHIADRQLQEVINADRLRLSSNGRLATAEEVRASVMQKLIQQEAATLRANDRNLSAQEANTRATAAVTARYTDDVQRRVRNQFGIQGAMVERLRTIVDEGEETGGTSSSQRTAVDQFLQDIAQPAFELAIKTEIRDTVRAADLQNVMRASFAGQRASQPGELPDETRERARARVRERVMRPYMDLYRGTTEAQARSDIGAVTGSGFDQQREQQSLLSNFYMGLSRLVPDIQGEMASAQLRLALLTPPQLMAARNGVLGAAAGMVTSSDATERLLGTATQRQVLRQAEGQFETNEDRAKQRREVEREIEGLNTQLTALQSSAAGFLANLTDNQLRGEITKLMQDMETRVRDLTPARDRVSAALTAGETATTPEAIAVANQEIADAMLNYRTVLSSGTKDLAQALQGVKASIARVSQPLLDREFNLLSLSRSSAVQAQNYEMSLTGQRLGLMRTIEQASREGRLGDVAGTRSQLLQAEAGGDLERARLTLQRRRAEIQLNNPGPENAMLRQRQENEALRDFEVSRLEILRRSYDAQRELILEEDNRIAAAREEQFQSFLQDSVSGLRTVLMDFNQLRNKPLMTITEGLAQASQQRIVDNFMDALFGPMGVFTDQLRSAFTDGAMESYSSVYSAHLDGIRAGAEQLRQAYQQAIAESGLSRPLAQTGSTTTAVPGAQPAVLGGAGTTSVSAGGQEMTVDEYLSSIGSLETAETMSRRDLTLLESEMRGYGLTPVRTRASDTGALAAALASMGILMGSDGMVDMGGGRTMPLSDVGNASKTASRPGAWNNLKGRTMIMGGQMGGAWLGGQLRGGPDYAGEGSSIGAALGMSFGPIGGMLGGIAGGLIGGLFGKRRPQEDVQVAALERIERNTRQQVSLLQTQTRLLQLDGRFLNVAAGFTIPSYRPYGSGGAGAPPEGMVSIQSLSVTVNTRTDASADAIGTAVAKAIQSQLSQTGRAFDTRVM